MSQPVEVQAVMTIAQAQELVRMAKEGFVGQDIVTGELFTETGCCGVGAMAISAGIADEFRAHAIELLMNDEEDTALSDLSGHIARIILNSIGVNPRTIVRYYVGRGLPYDKPLYDALWKYFDNCSSVEEYYEWIMELATTPASQ